MAAAAADTVSNIGGSPMAATRSSQYHFADSPKSQRQSVKTVSSPWSQVARREFQPIATAVMVEPVFAPPSSSASSLSDEMGPEPGLDGNTGKKAPWNRPSDGPGHEESVLVIGGDSWPALSASSGKISRKSSSESAKALLDGSSPVSTSQGNGIGPSSPSHPSSERQRNSPVNAYSNVNHPMSTHQRSTKPNDGNTSSNGDAPGSPDPHNTSPDTQSSNSFPGDDSLRSGSVSENHGGDEHQQPQRNSFGSRRGGAYRRGDGSHSQNYENRRNQDRSNQEWNSARGFYHNREGRMQQQRGFPRYGRGVRPAAPVATPASAPFIASPQHQHFAGPSIGYNYMPPPVYYVPVQHPMNFVSPMQPQVAYLPQSPLTLHTRILNQVNYYFSEDNLAKDTYLRRKMDVHGWVPVALIANFKKENVSTRDVVVALLDSQISLILELTDNVELILDVVRTSSIVEVQGGKLRRRKDWKKWIMPPNQFPDASGAQSSTDSLAASVQTLALAERAGNGEASKSEAGAQSSKA